MNGPVTYDTLVPRLLKAIPEFATALSSELAEEDGQLPFVVLEDLLPQFLSFCLEQSAAGNKGYLQIIERTVAFLTSANSEAIDPRVGEAVVLGFLARLDTLRQRGSHLWDLLTPELQQEWERYCKLY